MKGKGVGRLISTFTHLCNSARDTSSASPSCSLLSGRISTLKDETGAVSRESSKVGWPVGGRTGLPTHSRLPCPPPIQIFIDRDPTVFAPILNFLRTKELDPRLVWVREYVPPSSKSLLLLGVSAHVFHSIQIIQS